MDPLHLFEEGQGERSSHSQDLQHLMKSDRESLDDFEHVTKEVPTSQDTNLQFINFEKGQTEIADTIKEADKKPSPTTLSGKATPEKLGDIDDFLVKETTQPDPIPKLLDLDNDPFGSSKNFMQYENSGISDSVTKKDDDFDAFLRGETKPLDPLDDSDQSQPEDDDSIVTPAPKKEPEIVKPLTPEPPKPITPEPVKIPTPVEVKPLTPEPDIVPPVVKIEEEVPVRPAPKIPEHRAPEPDDGAPPPAPVPRDYPEIGVLEPKDILAACGLYTLFHPERLNPKVEALVYWRDPKRSGIVFGSVLVVLLSLTLFSLISVVAYTSLAVLVAATSFRIYKSVLQAVQKTSEGHPFNTYLLPALQNPVVCAIFQIIQEYLEVDLTLSPDRVREATDVAVAHLNSALTELRRRFLVEDLVDSVKFGLLLYVLTYLGSWFNGLTLIILGFVALFTLPKVYENNQAQIDANLDLVRGKINEVTDKIKAVIPIGKKSEGEAKDKNE